jgi:hypothetical protein
VPDDRGDGRRDAPPADVLNCIVSVIGSVPDRPLTDDEITRVKTACSSGDEGDLQGEKSVAQKKQERRSDSAIDARKLAFCESNPADSHCSGGSSGTSDGKDAGKSSGGDSGSKTRSDDSSTKDSGSKSQGKDIVYK